MKHKALYRGDLVEVRSPSEILATLDDTGALAGLPFMPEMVAYCGRRFTVSFRADKVCDTVNYTGSRRIPNTVMLADLRCDGSGHCGCQAKCRIFWKDDWLRKVTSDAPPVAPFPPSDVQRLLERTSPHTRWSVEKEGNVETRFRCQNTSIPACSDYLSVWDPRPYLQECASGNVSLPHFLRVTSRAAVTEPLRKLGYIPEIHLPGTASPGDKFEPLNLQPGELVRVKTKEEIAKTLTPDGRNKGLWFDREMLPYCGRVFRVRERIERFINERDGKLLVLKSQPVTLEGAVCSGDRSTCRWLCPRAIYPYWRECWLERVATPRPVVREAGTPLKRKFTDQLGASVLSSLSMSRSRCRATLVHGYTDGRRNPTSSPATGCRLPGLRANNGQTDDRTIELVAIRRSRPWIPMPYKFNESRRHKIPQARYRVTNWPEYDSTLVRRGGVTVWFTDEAVAAWHAPATGARGGQPIYSAIAIETGLTLRLVFHQPLRQTEGLLRSIADVPGISIAIPDHTTLSRRADGLRILPKHIDRAEPLYLLVDSTGLKIYGEGEWLDQKHGIRSHRRWRKLHFGMNAGTHEIVAVELTPDDVGDVSEIPHLLDQIEADVVSMTADGAYDSEAVYNAVAKHHPDAAVIIPPRVTAVASGTTATQRDLHIATIAQHGRMDWQRRSGYDRRSLIETAMFRYKTIVGRRLHARTLPNQRTEARIGCNILNRMTGLGMPTSVRGH